MKKKENPTAGIEGFLKKPKHSAGGRIYRGRFTFPGIQWTGDGADALVTFTITAEELADIAESRLLWTDQDVQRGIRPEIAPQRPLVNCLLARAIRTHAVTYSMLRTRDDITEKLLRGDKLFLSPLIWKPASRKLRGVLEP